MTTFNKGDRVVVIYDPFGHKRFTNIPPTYHDGTVVEDQRGQQVRVKLDTPIQSLGNTWTEPVIHISQVMDPKYRPDGHICQEKPK